MSPQNDKSIVIYADKYVARTLTTQSEIEKGNLKKNTIHRMSKYLNDIIE